MDYENYSERIKPLFDFETFKKPKADCKDVVRISVINGEMTTHKICKTKFSQLNDKKFYFPNRILSLPYSHASLKQIDDYKKNKGQRIEKYFWIKKENLLELEKKALKETSRLDYFHYIYRQIPKIFKLDCTRFDRTRHYLYKDVRQQTVIDFILSAGWKETESMSTTKNSKVTFLL